MTTKIMMATTMMIISIITGDDDIDDDDKEHHHYSPTANASCQRSVHQTRVRTSQAKRFCFHSIHTAMAGEKCDRYFSPRPPRWSSG